MSLSSNLEYSNLKKKEGRHNWAGRPSREILERELFKDVPAELTYEGILHPSVLGGAYALVGITE